jgi:pilus assembly protein CpaB
MIAVVFAIVFGGSAAVGVRQYVKQGPTAQVETVSVIVAAVNIPRGVLVSTDLITTSNYPKDLAPTGAILKIEDVLNRSAFTTMVKGEPVLESKLSPKGQRGLASLVAEGMRAFTITTNVASGVAGFILPGNKVDVLLTFASGGSNDFTGGGSTTTLLQNVEILAVDQKVEAPLDNKVDSSNLRSVTLLVTPDQAAKLSLGQNKGTLHLTLRNPVDKLAAKVRPTTVNDIQFLSEAPSKSWNERVSEVIKVWGEAQAKARSATATATASEPAPAPDPAPAEAKRMRIIRTLRGTSEGMVILSPEGSPG